MTTTACLILMTARMNIKNIWGDVLPLNGDDFMVDVKTIAVSNETHSVLKDLKAELKMKKYDQLLKKLAAEYIDQRSNR